MKYFCLFSLLFALNARSESSITCHLEKPSSKKTETCCEKSGAIEAGKATVYFKEDNDFNVSYYQADWVERESDGKDAFRTSVKLKSSNGNAGGSYLSVSRMPAGTHLSGWASNAKELISIDCSLD